MKHDKNFIKQSILSPRLILNDHFAFYDTSNLDESTSESDLNGHKWTYM